MRSRSSGCARSIGPAASGRDAPGGPPRRDPNGRSSERPFFRDDDNENDDTENDDHENDDDENDDDENDDDESDDDENDDDENDDDATA